MATGDAKKRPVTSPSEGVTEGVTSGKLGVTEQKTAPMINEATVDGKTYRRDTHEAFFKVLDWLQNHPQEANDWGLGKIAKATDVSKPYVSKARQWWQEDDD